MTDCKTTSISFQAHNRREVVGIFNGGEMTSDGGGLLLRETESRLKIIERFSGCFTDSRHPNLIEHSLRELVSQRIYGLCLGYEDLNDHDDLRHDKLLALLVGKEDLSGKNRHRKQDQGIALAGKSTLNRLEQTVIQEKTDRYHKIGYDPEAVDRLMTDLFVESYETQPERIVLDLDNTDQLLHGSQEGRFFHGYYGNYCYLPLYVFCGEHLLLARLQTANVDGAAYAKIEVARIVEQIRVRWPKVPIILRGDSGFCREELMAWCEANQVDYVFGLAQNQRLLKKLSKKMTKSKRRYFGNKQATRRYKDFRYSTLKTWSRSRRVIGKAEYLGKGPNPRFIVTSLSKNDFESRSLYEDFYCARGNMENRIKEQQLDLFADRMSCAFMRSNQLRLYFSSFAYILLQGLRRLGLKGTSYAKAQCKTIRHKFLKIGAQIKISVRRIVISLASAYPYASVFLKILAHLQHPAHSYDSG